MKNTQRLARPAAALLATVALTTLLAPAAHAAPPAAAEKSPHAKAIVEAPVNGTTFQLLFPVGDGSFWGVDDGTTRLKKFDSRADAVASSPRLTTKRTSDTTFVAVLPGTSPELCLAEVVYQRPMVRESPCALPSAQLRLDDSEKILIGSQRRYISQPFLSANSGYRFTSTDSDPAVTFEGLGGVSATTFFSNDTSKEAVITGIGEPDALVQANLSSSLKPWTLADSHGEYSITVPAPNRGGVLTGVVYQLSNGVQGPAKSVEIDFGPGVSVATPLEGSIQAGKPLALSGTGTPGGSITVTDSAPGHAAKTADVDGNGRWSLTTSALEPGEHRFTAEQLSRGNNRTTATVTINVKSDTAPLKVTAPATGSTVTTSRPIFSGTGEPGAKVSIAYGKTVFGTRTVDADGTWSITPTSGLTLGQSTITVTHVSDSGTQTTSVVVNRLAAEIAFGVTSPADGSRYTEGVTTFTGRAMPGTTIVATNQWNTVMGRATANLAGDWTFTRNLGPTTNGYDIRFVATKGTDTQTKQIHLKNAISNVPVQVGSIRDGATYRPGMNILSGTGTPGATINAVNATNNWNVPMGSATVGTDGKWALPERNWGPSNDYQIKVTQTNPDKTTSTTTINIKAPVTDSNVAAK